MGNDWHYIFSGQRNGPISQALLLKKMQEGQFSRDILVWREGMSDWRKASEIPEFMPSRTEPPPIPVNVPPPIPFAEKSHVLNDADAGRHGVAKPLEDLPERKVKPRSKGWGGTIIVIVVGLVAAVIGKGLGKVGGEVVMDAVDTSRKFDAVHEGLEKAAAQLRSDLPKRVDEITQLTSVNVSGTTISYVMKIDDNVQESVIYGIRNSIQELNQKRTCAAQTKELIAAGGKMVWQYVHKGATFATASVSSCR